MEKPHAISGAALLVGILSLTSAFAGHQASAGSQSTAPSGYAGYGGMPAWGQRYPGYAPYGYKRPMSGPFGYGPGYGKPSMPPMRGYMPGYRGYRPGQTGSMPGYPAAAQPAQANVALPGNVAKAATEEPSASGEVAIRQMQFAPARLIVKKGATVTWTQNDRMPHNVIASNGAFGSDTLTGGQQFSKTFDEAGTYGYYCSLHPSMRGEVVVVE